MKCVKPVLVTLLSVFVVLEILFNLLLPNIIELDKFKPMITDLVKDQAQLTLNYENAKIITTPLFGIGIKAENISIKLPDDSLLFSADKIKTRIALPSILLMTVKISCLEIEKPFVNVEIVNDENYKIVNLIEDIINNKKIEKLENPKNDEKEKTFFNPAWIRIKIPNVKLSDYKLVINDIKSGHYLNFHGDELKLGYFNGRKAKLKTIAQLDSDKHTNITLNADITTILPKSGAKLDEEDDEPERLDIPFTNPVTMYRKYDLKTNIDAKLNIRGNSKYGYTSYGHLNISDLSLNIGQSKIPESYLNFKTFGKNIDIDTNLAVKEKQRIKLNGQLRYGNHPNLDMAIKTDKIYFNDLISLTRALLNSLAVPNEMNNVCAKGYFEADSYIKTNFKKLKSNGYMSVKNGALIFNHIGELISNANIDLIFDDNMLKIDKSGFILNNSPVKFEGSINKKNIADIKITAEKINIPQIFLAITPKHIRNNYNLNSGVISTECFIKGKIKNPNINSTVLLEKINLTDKKRTFKLFDEKSLLTANIVNNKLKAGFNNTNLLLELINTKSKIQLPNIAIKLNDKDVSIDKNSICLNDKTRINYHGEIKDYTELKNIDIFAESLIDSSDVMKFIGQDFDKFFNYRGAVPFELSLTGTGKKITTAVKLSADINNYFTPVEVKELKGKLTVIQSIIDIKPKRIKIKDTGIFEKSVTYDKKGHEQVHLTDVMKINGTIAGDNINVLRVFIPKTLNGNIYVFPQSSFILDKCHAFVMGRLSNPRALGNITISNLRIPELLLSIDKISSKIKGSTANIKIDNLMANQSDMAIESSINMLSMPLELSNVNFSSGLMDIDKLMKVADKTMSYLPQQSNSAKPSVTTQNTEIPVIIRNGKIGIDKLKTGNITVDKIKSDISLNKNVFYLNNLSANAFDGKTNGDISVNLLNTLINIEMKGKNINVDKALIDTANMKNTLRGKCDFSTKLSLKGSTYEEQMKSLIGDVKFLITNGQFGPFGKLENLILAENIRESEFFKTALGGVISSLTTIDTTHFSTLKGEVNFEDGICHINEITTQGNVLALHIFGNFDILKNYADMKVRAKMASIISNLLGPIAMINPVNIMNSAAGLNVVTAKAFSIFCETLSDEEIKKLPPFSNNYIDNAATKFQLVVRGDAAKPLTLIKSFKWLVTQIEFNKANDFVTSIPDAVEGSTAATVQELIEENKKLEAKKKTLGYKLMHLCQPKNKK